MAIIKLLNNTNLNGYSLIIPSVSVGNVPQLTIDLLISNFNLQKAGLIWHPAVVPSVGADPFGDSPEICTACELYINSTLKLAVLQIRSSLEPKLVSTFFQDLKADILEHKISKIFILSSAFDYELHLIDRGKFFYFDSSGTNVALEKKGVQLMDSQNGRYFVEGGGYTVKLYEVMKDVCPCTVLVKYVSEGDNRPDAISVMQILFDCIEKLTKIDVKSIKFPSSWAYVFGGPPPIGMY